MKGMSKVLVDRELLENCCDAAKDAHAASLLKELEAILDKPAEAEEVEVVGYAVTWIRVGETPEKTVFMSAADFEATGGPRFYSYREPLVLQSAHLAALSAVTAERDRLRDQVKALQSDANSWQSGYDKGRHDGTKHRQSEVGQLRAKLEALRPIHAMILNALDRDAEEGKTARGEMAAELRAAMAAKEA